MSRIILGLRQIEEIAWVGLKDFEPAQDFLETPSWSRKQMQREFRRTWLSVKTSLVKKSLKRFLLSRMTNVAKFKYFI